jgi:hypothetical protein
MFREAVRFHLVSLAGGGRDATMNSAKKLTVTDCGAEEDPSLECCGRY